MCPSWRPGAAHQDTVVPSGEVQVCIEIPGRNQPRTVRIHTDYTGQKTEDFIREIRLIRGCLSYFFSKPEHTITGRRGYLGKFGSVAERWQR